jgi:hypothetical protein
MSGAGSSAGRRFAAALAVSALAGIAAIPLAAEAPDVSGTIEGKAVGNVDDGGTWAYSFEEYSNLRVKAFVGEKAVVNVAANLIASSGDASDLSLDAEIERLYFSVGGEKLDFDAGLMRLPFGFGQGFRPVDAYAKPNPLYPDARYRGVLAAAATAYPAESVKLSAFFVDGDDALHARGSLPLARVNRPSAGASAEIHLPALSAQSLFIYDLPEKPDARTRTRIGASLKFDLVAGFALDALYTIPEYSRDADECLEAAIGADWSFDSGKFYLFAQYFYNGDGGLETDDGAPSVDADPVFAGKHYATGSASWHASDYTTLSGGVTVALDDRSLVPTFGISHEPFQGMTVSLDLRSPLALGAGNDGEFGPERSRSRGSATLGGKLKF